MLGVEPTKGGFDLDAARLIAPGDPYNSVLFYRVMTRGIGHMPMLGSATTDKVGVGLVHDWIESLGPTPEGSFPENPDTATNALILAHHLLQGKLDEKTKKRILEEAAKSPNLSVMSLFSGW